MFRKKPDNGDKSVKNLSEKDIQKQLYGGYLDKFEVMDSSALVKEKEPSPIQEKVDVKARKEISAELDGLKDEFKRLQHELARLRKDKEALEKADIWFKPPFMRTRQLVIIGSLVVLLAIGAGSFFAIKYFVFKIGHKDQVPALDTAVPAAKKDVPQKTAPAKKAQKKPAKDIRR